MNESVVKEVIDRTFLDAGFRACTLDTNETPLFRIYEGNGMVWGVSVLNSFEMFERQWCPQQKDEARVTNLLARASSIDERWNLTILVVVLEPITEGVLPLISQFQEDPTAYARFVLAIDPDFGASDLEDRIGFLLLRWLNAPSGKFQEDITIEADIRAVMRQVASETNISGLDSTVAAIASVEPDHERILAALQDDVERNTKHETQ